MIGVGFIVSTWVGYGSSKVPATSSFSWRFPLAFQCIPCLIILCGMLFFPESPRYLVEIDRADDALKVLKKLHYDGTNDDWIQNEFNEIKLTIDAEKAITAPGWKIMFTVPVWRKRLMHATLVQVFTQMTGYGICQLVGIALLTCSQYQRYRLLLHYSLQESRHSRRSQPSSHQHLQRRWPYIQPLLHRLPARSRGPQKAPSLRHDWYLHCPHL